MKASARRASRRRSRPPQTFLGGAANANTNASASKGVPEIMSKLSEEPQDTTMEDQWCDNTSITPLPGQQAQDPGVASARTMSPTPPFSATSAIFSTFSDSFDIPQRRRQQQNYNTINNNNNNNNNGHDDDDDGGGKEGADDNISVLTDCSWMMDEDEDEYGEEDANSQIAAVSVASESLTVATTTTDSTTLPTNNHLLNQNQHHNHMDPPEPRKKRRQVLSVAHDNGPFKRRKRM